MLALSLQPGRGRRPHALLAKHCRDREVPRLMGWHALRMQSLRAKSKIWDALLEALHVRMPRVPGKWTDWFLGWECLVDLVERRLRDGGFWLCGALKEGEQMRALSIVGICEV